MDTIVLIRTVQQCDSAVWERLCQAFWPAPSGEHADQITRFFDGDRRNPAEVLLAIEDSGQPVGLVELSIRPYAEGCYSGRVAYLEGWFVESSARDRGIGAALVKAAEDWARGQDCTELASDTALDNSASAVAHHSLGFEEINRIICFRKKL